MQLRLKPSVESALTKLVKIYNWQMLDAGPSATALGNALLLQAVNRKLKMANGGALNKLRKGRR